MLTLRAAVGRLAASAPPCHPPPAQVIKGFAAKSDGKDKLTALVQVRAMSHANCKAQKQTPLVHGPRSSRVRLAAAKDAHEQKRARDQEAAAGATGEMRIGQSERWLCAQKRLGLECPNTMCLALPHGTVLARRRTAFATPDGSAVPVPIPFSRPARQPQKGAGIRDGRAQGVSHPEGERARHAHGWARVGDAAAAAAAAAVTWVQAQAGEQAASRS